MKTLRFLVILSYLVLVSLITGSAQVPMGFNYQAVVRNVSGELLIEQQVHIRAAVLDGGPEGELLFEETHLAVTDAYGQFSIVIGRGTLMNGSFDEIAWESGPKFLQISMDPSGGNNFSEIGSTQLLSVPYALYARQSGDPGWESRDSLVTYLDGNVGIGTGEPGALLHIDRTVTPGDTIGDTIVVPLLRLSRTDTASTGMGGVLSSGMDFGIGGDSAFIMSNHGSKFSIGINTREQSNMEFITGGAGRMFIDPEGKVGIGISEPLVEHHVYGSDVSSFSMYSTPTSGQYNGLFIGMSDRTGYIENTNSDFGLNLNTGGSGKINLYGSGGVNIVALNSESDVWLKQGNSGRIVLGTGLSTGFTSKVVIDAEGKMGIGTGYPQLQLDVWHPSSSSGGTDSGLRLLNSGGNLNRWAFYVANDNGSLELWFKSTYRGGFSATNGDYSRASDLRLKKNIQPMGGVLETILLLVPSTFRYTDVDDTAPRSIGFIAQEVQPYFPELVGFAGEGGDMMTLNYDGFGVLAIRAIQEQQAVIDQLLERIVELERQYSLKSEQP